MKRLGLGKIVFILSVFCGATAVASPAQTFTTLLNFDMTNGAYPFHTSLVQGLDGKIYGTASSGGADPTPCRFNPGCGTLFEITTGGTLTKLLKLNGTDGISPYAGLVQTGNGTFYGTTNSGGANNAGTIFKITGGTLTTLYNFCAVASCADGIGPESSLVQATNGSLYGTTNNGGATGDGTVFKITPQGALTTLHSFKGGDGTGPAFGALVEATDGNFYGTTQSGGTSSSGTVFKMTAAGRLTTLHSFNGSDGTNPNGVVQGTDGNLYGTTLLGGANGQGTVFEITTGGTLTTLYSFCVLGNPCPDGKSPGDGLVQATDGNFYGTTASGGANGSGTIYSITPGGTLTTIHSFAGADVRPYTVLMQATDGNFYGTTEQGGLSNCSLGSGCGTVFSLSVGLTPFVKTNPTFGKVGWSISILGTNLTGASAVSFNGTAATTFTVISETEIKATVPSGATSGTIQVTTPGGILSSNVAFQVE
ncbi:MAG TPA: choice-of-anchor tandem repeat GloVer-containing protein [Candidatus Sulfotelmatobacter sp.]|jgi:uncharacterized repeat protein (TIGR03803 family)|nr:choice-of-anchor tandem repeat GloVer-containing protein [Candidatus Sulfotelmatobacter sp.]